MVIRIIMCPGSAQAFEKISRVLPYKPLLKRSGKLFLILAVIYATAALTVLNFATYKEENAEIAEQQESGQESDQNDFTWPHGPVAPKKSFSKKWTSVLRKFGLDHIPVEKVGKENEKKKFQLDNRTVIVTGFSSNHYGEALPMLKSVQDFGKRFDEKPLIYIYDVGLTDEMRNDLKKKFGQLVTIRKFPFDQYPNYVSRLVEYRWKPLLVAEMFATTNHSHFWWFDASIRIRKRVPRRHPSEYFVDYVRSKGDPKSQYALTFNHYSSHSVFAATAPGMYDYFPMSEETAKKTPMYGSGVYVIFKTQSTRRDILKWWVLCALEEDCMAPEGHALFCAFQGDDRDNFYADCHRYDQSSLNILVATMNGYDISKYMRDVPGGSVEVQR